MQDTPEFLRKEMEKQDKMPLLNKAWTCRLPSVDKVWFTSGLSAKGDGSMILYLHLLFYDKRRVDFHHGTEDELIAQAEEYLQSIKEEERKYERPLCERCVTDPEYLRYNPLP